MSTEKFKQSMVIDYEKWHDGVGYDLDALREAPPREIETILLTRGAQDWRDVEALAALGTPPARAALQAAMHSADAEIRLAVSRYAPDLVPVDRRTVSLVNALKTAEIGTGLSQALDEAEVFHPQEVLDALLDGAQHREGEAPVLFAGMLLFLYGKAASSFDWDQRPFLLRFRTDDRQQVFAELRAKLGI